MRPLWIRSRATPASWASASLLSAVSTQTSSSLPDRASTSAAAAASRRRCSFSISVMVSFALSNWTPVTPAAAASSNFCFRSPTSTSNRGWSPQPVFRPRYAWSSAATASSRRCCASRDCERLCREGACQLSHRCHDSGIDGSFGDELQLRHVDEKWWLIEFGRERRLRVVAPSLRL